MDCALEFCVISWGGQLFSKLPRYSAPGFGFGWLGVAPKSQEFSGACCFLDVPFLRKLGAEGGKKGTGAKSRMSVPTSD